MPKAGLQFQKRDEWFTPKEVMDFFGPFDYDPATTEGQAKRYGILRYDTIETDGLKRQWGQFRTIWINPPFTRKFEFLDKAIETVMWSGSKIFFLLPAETITTKKFHEIVGGQPYTLWVPNGRIKFEDGSGGASSPAFGSVVLEFYHGFVGTQIKHWRLDGGSSS